jgi:hypothetical protein
MMIYQIWFTYTDWKAYNRQTHSGYVVQFDENRVPSTWTSKDLEEARRVMHRLRLQFSNRKYEIHGHEVMVWNA